MGGDDYVIDGDLVFSNTSSALKFYQEQYHKKKEWVGLTDEEAVERANKFRDPETYLRGVLWAEAKIKEKNNG